ncbi:hypothetical protein [Trichocoleus sp. FACHB-262]|uniref:hypothetical protein n=1 Tax=Trichocoleus sp. FACHB-262 TaxID=2692869 RepID=UPI0018EFCB59|nr:hypothetical protein [Trichocoleus sp. FACHB-262]
MQHGSRDRQNLNPLDRQFPTALQTTALIEAVAVTVVTAAAIVAVGIIGPAAITFGSVEPLCSRGCELGTASAFLSLGTRHGTATCSTSSLPHPHLT